MKEQIQFILTASGLCLQFQTTAKKNIFLADMHQHHIDIFTTETGPLCYIKKYSKSNPTGQFVSHEQRVALIFESEKQKFLFKEIAGLQSEHFMDMGPGYDNQLHFNVDFLPNIEGASLTTNINVSETMNDSLKDKQ